MELDRFLSLCRALNEAGVEYVVVGATALNIHGIIRATEDIDLFVNPESENVARLRNALKRMWGDPDIEEIGSDDLAGPYPTIRYGPPNEDFVIDLIGRLGTEVAFEDLRAEIIALEGVPVRVATPLTLYRMKRATIRPIDKADALALKEKFHLEDE